MIIASRHLILIGRHYFTSIFGKRNVLKKAVICIESQRSTTENKREEKLSHTARRKVLTCVLPRDPKHSPLSPTATVSVTTEKENNSKPTRGNETPGPTIVNA